tara:strand:- start:78 stop:485 length:408 start_codon:yes stop_codon:yes gene_type:complete
MQKKILLVATFVNDDYLDKFLFKIYKRFNVSKKSVFVFETDNGELLLTYRIYLEIGKSIDIRKEIPKTVQIHKKGTTFFTINALNQLIIRDHDLYDMGNIDYKNYDVDWGNYENCLILLKNNELDILPLTKKNVE